MYFQPLNALRFVLASGVILFHYGLEYYPFNTPVVKDLIVHSSFRVSFFFFISGFIMTLVYARRGGEMAPSYFYRRRFSRLFPAYWLAFIITLVLLLFVNRAAPKGIIILLHFFGLQSLDPGYVLDLNYTTWSISVELVFYALFPFVLKWMLKQQDKKLLVICCVVWLLQSLQHISMIELLPYNKATEEFISTFPLWHMPTFFAGMVTARCTQNNMLAAFKKNAALFFCFSLVLLAYVIFIPNPVLKYVHNGLLSPVFALLIVSLFYDTSLISRLLSLKPFATLGTLSYGLFIFQYPVWLICTALAGDEFLRTGWFFGIYFFSLLLFAFSVNRLFEKPMMKFLRKNKPSAEPVVSMQETLQR